MRILQIIIYFPWVLSYKRIENGNVIKDSTKFPFFAMFIIPSSNSITTNPKICGGSLIHPRWILTAGHCLPKNTSVLNELTNHGHDMVFMGSIYMKPTPNRQARKLIEIHRHPKYRNKEDHQRRGTLNDLALLKVNKPFKLSNSIQIVRLSTLVLECEFVMAIGIELTHKNNTSPPPVGVVKYTRLLVMRGKFPHTPKTIFYAVSGKELNISGHATKGDCGGPLICENAFPPLLVGVLSDEAGEDNIFYHAAERIDFFIGFIKEHVPIDKFTRYLLKPKKEEDLRKTSKASGLISTINFFVTYRMVLESIL